MRRVRAALQLVVLPIGAGAAMVLLWRMGDALPLPRGATRAQVDEWLRHEGPVTATFAVARAAGLILAAYAFTLGLLASIAALSQAARLTRLTILITVPSLRPLIAPVAAMTLTLAAGVPAGAQERGDPRPPVPVMVLADTRPAPVMDLTPSVKPAAPSLSPATHTVVPGDTLWSIAEDTLRAHGRTPSDADIVPYWKSLIEMNRGRLRVAAEPDLIYPGQVFELPPIS